MSHLYAPETPLNGRSRETVAACHLLRQAPVRLLTLTGPGGVGKTRLALHVAGALVDEFTLVAAVSLAPISDPANVAAALAQTLGLHEEGDHDLFAQIVAHLGSLPALLRSPCLSKRRADCSQTSSGRTEGRHLGNS